MKAEETPQHRLDMIVLNAFPGITTGEVQDLITHSQLNRYPAGTVLCHENAAEGTFYLILEGEVEVTKVINQTEVRWLKNLGPGDFFGEMALIHNAPRSATVKAITSLHVLELSREAFDGILKRSSSVSLAMVREISRRLRENDEMAIDDLRQRASELAEAYQKLTEQEISRREFLTAISHQLRTPLMAAGGYLQLLQKGAIPASAISPVLDTVARNVQQITALVNDILFVQEMDLILGQFQPVDMVGMAREVVEKITATARGHNLSLHVKADPDLPPVAGDTRNLERALNALVDNAVKFSPDDGEVEIGLQREGEQVRITVKDQGLGIPPEKLPVIFDRFYHTDRTGDRLFEGLGLGLAIARQVIAQHKGRLDVESTPGQGSTFTMWLDIWKDTGA